MAVWATVATAIALAGCAGSFVAARGHARDDARRSQLAERSTSKALASDIQLALQHESDLVVAAAAFLSEHPDASEGQFGFWAEAVRALDRYPELIGIGYTTIVPDRELARYAATIEHQRPDLLRSGRLEIVPPGRRPYYCLLRASVTRVPASFIPAGTDYCAADSDVASTIESGRGAYQPFTVGPLHLLSIETPVYSTGVVPADSEARRATFVGWVGSGVAPTVVLDRALRGHPHVEITLAYRSGTQHAAFAAGTAPPRSFTHVVDLRNGWTVRTRSLVPSAGIVANGMAATLLFGGSAGSIFTGLFLFALGTGRARALRMVDDRTRQLGYQALHDGLTGLPNRSLVLDRAGQLVARSKRRPDCVPVAMFVDLDGFKHVNDTHGHGVGDRLLRHVALNLHEAVRELDTVGRLGGDEFVILLDTSQHDEPPVEIAQRLIEAVRQPIILEGDRTTLSTSASIGVAYGPRETADELLRDADLALYEAKRLGKDRYAVFKPHMHSAVKDRLELEADITRALAADEFFLLYQPTFDLGTGAILGVEALIRWRHPTRGVLNPDTFVPLAEETGQILPIGRWVLDEACRQAATWRDRGYDIGVAVNVSAYQLDRDGLPGDVRRALGRSGLTPQALTLEITESALMHDVSEAATRLRELKSVGARLAIDDFGTGYSSLSYLQQFPVDALKIDRSFISAIATSDEAAAIIRTLVQLGKTLHLETLAEGIEEPAQLERLQREHCDHGQGFLFARPLEPAAVESLLAAGASQLTTLGRDAA